MHVKKALKMNFKTLFRDSTKVSKIATVIISLALIRCICEPFRLQYYSASNLTYADIKPFLLGSLVAASGLLTMTVLSWFGKHKIIIATCISTVIVLLVLKEIYLIP
jgi:hypothetical protein